MTNLIIKDLAESRELDRHAMATFIGGLASGFLFTFPRAQQTSFPGVANFYNNFYNTTQFIADTFQFNFLEQDITIIDSPGAIAENLGIAANSSLKEIMATVPSGFPVS